MENSSNASQISLRGPGDWKTWISLIQKFAVTQEVNVWDFIDPDKANKAILAEPAKPDPSSVRQGATRVTDLDQNQISQLNFLYARYNEELKLHQKQQKALLSIQQHIVKTVGNYYSVIAKEHDVAKELMLLKDRVKPSGWAQEQDILDRYKGALKGPGRTKTETWVTAWQTVLTEAQELDLAETQGLRPTYDFLKAVSAIDSAFSKYWNQRIEEAADQSEEGWKTKIPNGIKISNIFLRSHHADRASHGKSIFATSFQGKDEKGDATADSATGSGESKSTNKPPKCLCNQRHYFGDCPYLNPLCREEEWKADEATQKKVEDKRQNPTTQGKIERSISRWKKAKGRDSSSRQPATKTKEANAIGVAFAGFTFKTALTAAQGDDPYPLRDSFILDSGANWHFCNNRNRFVSFNPMEVETGVFAGDTKITIRGIGEVHLRIKDRIFILKEVLYLPGFHVSAVSSERLVNKGFDWHAKTGAVIKDDATLFYTQRMHGLPVVEFNELQGHQITEASLFATAARKPRTSTDPRPEQVTDGMTWHRRMGHLSTAALEHLSEHTAGAVVKGPTPIDCESCIKAKAKRIPSRREPQERAERPYWRVYIDVFPFTTSYNGKTAALVIKDDYTRMLEAKVLNNATQDEILGHLQSLRNKVKHEFNLYICRIHRDNDPAFGNDYTTWITRKGITDEPTAPYTSAQNGPAERSGGVLATKARSMIIGANLPQELWPEAIQAAAYLHNRSPQQSLNWDTPFQRLHKWLRDNNRHTGYKETLPDITHLKAYGCRAYPLTTEALENTHKRNLKTTAHAEAGYLVGYASSNIFKIWIPERDEVRRVRDVAFDERITYDPTSHTKPTDKAMQQLELPQHIDSDSEEEAASQAADIQTGSVEAAQDDDEVRSTIFVNEQEYIATPLAQDSSSQEEHPSPPLPTPGSTASPTRQDTAQATQPPSRPKRDRKKSSKTLENETLERAGFKVANASATYFSSFFTGLEKLHRRQLPPLPKCWADLEHHQFGEQFKAAARDEVGSHWARGAFQRVPKDEATSRPLPLTWVFTYKTDKHGFLTKFKARLCVRGDLQPYNNKETYAATLAGRTFRVLMAIAAKFDLEARQLDAVNAFTNSTLDESIYVQFPDGFKEAGWVIKLIRALYGLRRSPLLWQRDLTTTFKELGFQACTEDPCVFKNGTVTVFFFVDDIVFLFREKDKQTAEQSITRLKATYEMKDLGDLQWFLGMRILRDRDTRRLWLCQDAFIEKMAATFHRPKKEVYKGNPLPHNDLQPHEGKASSEEVNFYQQKIGHINYAAVQTRPDIAKAGSKLAEFLLNPSKYHHRIAEEVIDYLYATRHLAIQFGGSSNTHERQLQAHQSSDLPEEVKQRDLKVASDAAFADDTSTRKSSQGFIICLFGGPISWKATKQSTVTMSSTEAELLAFTHTAREAIATQRLFQQLELQLDEDSVIECDNKQTIRLVNLDSPRIKTALKHVDVHNCWARQAYQEGHFKVTYTPTAEMLADGLTKALPRQRFDQFVKQLGLVDVRHLVEAPRDEVYNTD